MPTVAILVALSTQSAPVAQLVRVGILAPDEEAASLRVVEGIGVPQSREPLPELMSKWRRATQPFGQALRPGSMPMQVPKPVERSAGLFWV